VRRTERPSVTPTSCALLSFKQPFQNAPLDEVGCLPEAGLPRHSAGVARLWRPAHSPNPPRRNRGANPAFFRDELPARLYRDLTMDERREIELEENIRRKDLTTYELSKQIVELATVAAKIIDDSLSTVDNESTPAKRKKGGQGKPASAKKIAEKIGVPRKTNERAKQHVAAIAKYPELTTPGIPQKAASEDKIAEKTPQAVAATTNGGRTRR